MNESVFNFTQFSSTSIMNESNFNDSLFSITPNTSEVVCPSYLVELTEKIRNDFATKLNGQHYKVTIHVLLSIAILGYITNVINVIVLRRTSLSSSMNTFLLALAISDIMLITSYTGHLIHHYCGLNLIPHSNWVLFFIIIWYALSSSLVMCNWLAATIGIWRCIVITWPLQSKQLCTSYRARIIIVSIAIGAILTQIPIFYTYAYEIVRICDRELYKMTRFDIDYLMLSMLHIRGLIPLIIIVAATLWIIASLYLVRKYRKRAAQKEKKAVQVKYRITLMLAILLLFHLLSSSRRSINFVGINISGGEKENFFTFPTSVQIDNIFMLMNCAVSFFIYFGLCEDFRKTFKKIFLVNPLIKVSQSGISSEPTGVSDTHLGERNCCQSYKF